MRKHARKLIVLALVTISTLGIFTLMSANPVRLTENAFIKKLIAELDKFGKRMPEDRVYLQFDKPFYQPGEAIWFSAYIRNGSDLKQSEKSDIVHVELINPKGAVERHIKLVGKKGQAAGDFQLSPDAPGGIYKIKAYTNWQKNENTFFEKEVQVQEYILPALKMKLDFERKAFGAGDEVLAKVELNTNENKPLSNYIFRCVASLNGTKLQELTSETDESGTGYIRFKLPDNLRTNDGLLNVMIDYLGSTESISRSIPIILNKIQFGMFPEGGDLVEGLASRVAFRALNEFNKPADVEGVVLNSKGEQVAEFSSFHMGMGAFDLKPLAGEKYTVKITKPVGITETFAVPEAMPKGYILSAALTDKGEIEATVQTTQTEELSLVVQVRSKIYFAKAFNTAGGASKILIPAAELPIGVAQVTLFDQKGIERAERLVFVNKHKQLNVSITTDKQKYLPREKVKMTVTVKDDRGIPMPANLSLSVTNDQLLSFADDKSGNILSQLLLEQDIKDKVEEPAFYFEKDNPKAGKALDYLLMTSGWRRFTWEQIAGGEIPIPMHNSEQAVIAGTLQHGLTGKPIANGKIKVGQLSVLTDDQGKFALRNVDPVFPVMMEASADGFNVVSQYAYDYTQGMSIALYKPGDYANLYPPYPSSAPTPEDVAFNKMEKMAVRGAVNKNPMEMAMAEGKGRKDKEFEKPAPAPKPEKKAAQNEQGVALMEMEVMDDRLDMGKPVVADQGAAYYRAREFAAPVYDKEETVEERTDFRSTIYWNGNLEIDRSGKKTIEFYNSDDISSFRAIAEGLSVDGMIGRAEMTYFTQLPFAMSTKIPVEIIAGDYISIPLTLRNNTEGPLGGFLTVNAPAGLNLMAAVDKAQTIMPGKAKVIYLNYKVSQKASAGEFSITFKSCGLGDGFTQKVRITPKGFPVSASFSGQEMEREFPFELSNAVDSSLTVVLTAFPSVVNDLLSGIEGILREPSGCFEQTSMSSYPNAMVLDYLKTSESKDNKTIVRASNLLEKGYKRLTTFETKEKGYEWFGAAPGHEALTAYGLMQFADMKRVGGKVDQGMMDRTARWIMSRRDGKGGFERNARALDNFGRGSEDITNAYITYALADAGYTDIKKELDHSFEKAVSSKDPYMVALMANAMYKSGDQGRGDKLTDMLYGMQANDGSWTGKTHSITHSTGQSLTIETTSLAVMALLKRDAPNQNALNNGVKFLIGSRSAHGTFGNTQGTVLALKALTEFAKASKRTASDGTVEFYVDGKKVAQQSYEAGEKGNVEIKGLEKYIRNGKNRLKVKFKGTKEPLPYTVALNWNTTLPNSSPDCAVKLDVKLAAKTAKVGETTRLLVTLSNAKDEAVPNPIAIIGIPAGFSVQPWQLKEMQEKNVFDYYEVTGNNVVLYYRGMKAKEVKNINFDLKAEVPGKYSAPASSAYLYYTNEHKSWAAVDKVEVLK